MIRQSFDGTRHNTRLKAGRLLGGCVAGGVLEESEAFRVLEHVVRDNTDHYEKAVEDLRDGLEYGKAAPIVLKKKVVLFPQERIQTVPPTYDPPGRPPRLEKEQASELLEKAILNWKMGIDDLGIRSDAGSGKSTTAWKITLHPTTFLKGLHTAHFLVPTHKRGEELKAEIQGQYPLLDVLVFKDGPSHCRTIQSRSTATLPMFR